MLELRTLVSDESLCDLQDHRHVGTCKGDMNMLLVITKCWKAIKL
jgi:hypothetical protein